MHHPLARLECQTSDHRTWKFSADPEPPLRGGRGEFRTTYEPGTWTVLRVNGTTITARRGTEVITRNISWFRRVNFQEQEATISGDNEAERAGIEETSSRSAGPSVAGSPEPAPVATDERKEVTGTPLPDSSTSCHPIPGAKPTQVK